MKVIVAHNRYVSAHPSGENTVVAAEIDELTRAGVTVLPFLRDSDDIPTLPLTQRAALVVSPAYARRAQRELRELLTMERPDLVHLHNPYPLLSPWVIRTAHAQGIPVVHTMHNYRQTCVNGLFYRPRSDVRTSWLRSSQARVGNSLLTSGAQEGRLPDTDCRDCVGRVIGLPAVRHACYRGSRAQSAVMAATLALHRRTWPTVDRVLVLTPAMATYARDIGIPDERIVVRPNAVADPGRHTESGDGLLLAGRLSAEKGVELLLNAWDRHPDGALGRLRIAGDGPLANLVRARAAGRQDIEYLGRLQPSDVAAAMRRSAVVVVPSTWDEVCPVVAIEALANARPVFGTDRGGLPWLVGDAGWTVPPTVDALAAALPVAVAGAAGLAARARESYEQRFTPRVSTRSLLEVYRSLAPTG